jgi:hypothetical protein
MEVILLLLKITYEDTLFALQQKSSLKIFFLLICKLQTHPVGLEPTTSPSNLLLQGEEVSSKLELSDK